MVVVFHAAEGAADHGVCEMAGAVERGHADSERLPDAEVTSPPGDFLAGANESGRDASHGLFPGGGGGLRVEVDAAGEVEDALQRGGDVGGEDDGGHGGAAFSLKAGRVWNRRERRI